MTNIGPYRTNAKLPLRPKTCGYTDDYKTCEDEVQANQEYCCWHLHEMYGWHDIPFQGCGNPGCDCWP